MVHRYTQTVYHQTNRMAKVSDEENDRTKRNNFREYKER
jgi:hypothetical protein